MPNIQKDTIPGAIELGVKRLRPLVTSSCRAVRLQRLCVEYLVTATLFDSLSSLRLRLQEGSGRLQIVLKELTYLRGEWGDLLMTVFKDGDMCGVPPWNLMKRAIVFDTAEPFREAFFCDTGCFDNDTKLLLRSLGARVLLRAYVKLLLKPEGLFGAGVVSLKINDHWLDAKEMQMAMIFARGRIHAESFMTQALQEFRIVFELFEAMLREANKSANEGAGKTRIVQARIMARP